MVNSISFSSVNMIELNGKKFMRKIANENERQTTIDQIFYLKCLPENIKKYFPRIEEYTINDRYVSYLMPFYNMLQLDEALLSSSIKKNQIILVLEKLIDIMFLEIYPKFHIPTPKDYFLVMHYNRAINRIKYLLNQRADLFNLINSPYLIINGKECVNGANLLNKIVDSSYFKLLSPPFIGLVHGDLEANHIMFDFKNKSDIDIILLDPRVTNKGGDLAYDLAKLYQSIDGYSHEIQRGSFKFDINYSGKYPEILFLINGHRDFKEYNLMKNQLDKNINRHATYSDCSNWKARTSFIEAVHFLSAPPFFMHSQTDRIAEALYIQGVYLLNEFVQSINL